MASAQIDYAVPRRNPVPEREKAIGRRLREARERHGLHRTALAVRLGIGTERLASYESGRAPVPWVVGERFCDALFVGQTWLVTGNGGWDHYVPMRFDPPPNLRTLFSDFYDSLFLPQLKKARANVSEAPTPKNILSLRLRLAIQRVIRDSNLRLSPAEHIRVMAASGDILRHLAAAQKRAETQSVKSEAQR